MRVLFVNDLPLGPGSGVEVHIRLLADGLEARGDAVQIFAGEIQHSGASRALDLWEPRARRALKRLEGSFKPDVVHFHQFLTDLSPSVLGAVKGAARVLTLHGFPLLGGAYGPIDAPVDGLPMRLVKKAYNRAAREIARRKMHAVIAPTKVLAEGARAVGFANVHVVPHFVPVGAAPPSPPSASSEIVFAGRLHVEKGVAELIEAFALVAERHPDARLSIAGTGDERQRLEALATSRAPGRVRFLGLLDIAGVHELMGRARLVAAPSLFREAAGITVIDAASVGRAVVVSDDPALSEFVEEGQCGIVTPRRDVRALAGALDELLSNPARADALGAAARRLVLATRTPEEGVARTRAVYEDAVHRAGRGTGHAM